MGNISVEKKLELMRQVRSRHQRDRYDMFHREKLLYGRTTPVRHEDMGDMASLEYEEEVRFSTFPIRCLLAVGLFLMLVLCDRSGKSFFGIKPSRCFSAIAVDYEESIDRWVNASGHGVSDIERSGSTDLSDIASENPPAGSRP